MSLEATYSKVNSLNDAVDNIHNNSILVRTWKPAIGAAWIFFIVYQILIGCDWLYSKKPLCPYSDRHYAPWYFYTNYACLGGFIIIWLVLVMKLMQMETNNKVVPILVAFNIVTMGTVATILAVCFEWGGTCVDVLNVASPAAIWGEWCACGPLLIYINVTIIEKSSLSKIDWTLMICFFLCLITGFFIIIPSSIEVGQFWLTISCATYIPVLYLPFYDDGMSSLSSVDSWSGDDMDSMPQRYAKRTNIARWLTIVLPIYTLLYIVAAYDGIDYAQIIAMYQVLIIFLTTLSLYYYHHHCSNIQILSVLTKGLFAAATMDIHLDLLGATEKQLLQEIRANAARRLFMKYIFHEVRTPLNSLTVGINLLTMSNNLDADDRESLLIMKSASEFMSDTLDDVLNIQKIEEGKFVLDNAPFSLRESINKIVATFAGVAITKKVNLSSDIAENIPLKIEGDCHRIEHVLSNLVSNALKFSLAGGSVKCVATCEIDEHTQIAMVHVAIVDDGPGIAKEDQMMLFNNFVQVRPTALQKADSRHGSGLGLSFCKHIVELHHGKIGVSSEIGKGSSFHFSIPFPIASRTPNVSSSSITNTFDTIGKAFNSAQVGSSSIDDIPSIEDGKLYNICTDNLEGLAQSVKSATTDENAPTTVPKGKSASYSASNNNEDDDNHWLKHLNILVIDDSPTNRKILTLLVKRKGYAVDSAENGREAVDKVVADLEKHKLLLMDNLMPELNGSDASKALRDAGYPYLIVGLTGNVLDDDVDDYLGNGADTVMAKPMKDEYLNMLLEFIGKHGPRSKRSEKKVLKIDKKVEWVDFNNRR